MYKTVDVYIETHWMRSTAVEGDFEAWPEDEQAPLIAWMEERRRENKNLHLSQPAEVLYGWSNLVARKDANLL